MFNTEASLQVSADECFLGDLLNSHMVGHSLSRFRGIINGFSRTYQKLKHKQETDQASTVTKQQKLANDEVCEREEEMKNLQQAIELLENDSISLKTKNEELLKEGDDLTSHINQLEEALKAIEKGHNAKPEKEKQAQKEMTTIDKLQ